MRSWWLAGLLLLFSENSSASVDIKFYPADAVYGWPLVGDGVPAGMQSLMLHLAAVVNSGPEQATIESMEVELRAGDAVRLFMPIDAAQRTASGQRWQRREQRGVLESSDPLTHISRVANGLRMSSGDELPAGHALIIEKLLWMVQADVEQLVLRVRVRDASDETRVIERVLPVRQYQTRNRYRFPLQGGWTVSTAPSLHSHHRWLIFQEFFYDIVRFGDNNRPHRGDGNSLEMYYGYGEKVLAAGDGKVVAAVDLYSDTDSLPHPGESSEQHQQRLSNQQADLLQHGFAALIGNYVVIEHANGEYSFYAHLRPRSVSVKLGETVRAGERIGEVGNSGATTLPHLHFGIADSPDPTYSRSLPVRFDNVTVWDNADAGTGYLNSGQVVFTD